MSAFYFLFPAFSEALPSAKQALASIDNMRWFDDVAQLPSHTGASFCVLVMWWESEKSEQWQAWCKAQRQAFQGTLPILVLMPSGEWPAADQLLAFQPCDVCLTQATSEEIQLRAHLLAQNHFAPDVTRIFMGLFRKHPAVMFMLDAYTGEIVDANLSAQRFYGYELHAFLTMTVFDLNLAERNFVGKQMEKVREGVLNRFFFQHRLKSGEIRFVEINTTYMVLAERELLFTVVQDHTSREQAEQALQATEARYRQMVETAEEGIITLNAVDEITFVNQKMLTLLGAEHYYEVLGRPLQALLNAHEVQRYAQQKQRLQQGIKETLDLQLNTLSGQSIWVSVSMSLLFAPDGSIESVMGFVTNINARKAWEKDMERALHERSVLLQEVNHRVKNNFQLMLSMLRLQQRRIPKAAAEYAMLDAAAARLYTMALVHEQIYEKQGLTSLHFQQFVRLLVREVSAHERHVSPVFDFCLDDVVLSLDEAIVCSLILNEWLKNTYQYAFTEDFIDPRVHISFQVKPASDGSSQILLCLKNNGQGFDPEAPRAAGSLGLILAKHWARQLSGETAVVSDRTGTTCSFSFTLVNAHFQKPDTSRGGVLRHD